MRRNQKGFRVNTIRTLEKFHIRIHTRIHLTGIDQERESKEEFKEKKKKKRTKSPSIANSIIHVQEYDSIYYFVNLLRENKKQKKYLFSSKDFFHLSSMTSLIIKNPCAV